MQAFTAQVRKLRVRTFIFGGSDGDDCGLVVFGGGVQIGSWRGEIGESCDISWWCRGLVGCDGGVVGEVGVNFFWSSKNRGGD